MSRLDYEIKKMKKQKGKYELPLDFPYWTYDNQLTLAKNYKHVMFKYSISYSRKVFVFLMLTTVPLALVHISLTIFGACAWAWFGLSNERRIIDEFSKI